MPRKKISRSALRRMCCDNMIMKKSDLDFLLKNTRFDEQEITEFYKNSTYYEEMRKEIDGANQAANGRQLEIK